ncbi:response regulator [Bradyrhizobium japonicum]|uniref:response regulator n=1 Tax=Bradyrhizobium japonicum TaxID=375 RepID=UPI001BAD46EF|nr:response regulator [Bradyrhizobium japonicum]MBR0993099.1 response regulator [Bradyrhizobium japonicum]
MNLLVVDDEPAVCTVLKLLLMKEGHVVTVCDTGAAALAILAASRVDLALIDLSLPQVDGVSVIAAVRSLRPHIPIIVITGLLSKSSPNLADHPEIGPLDHAYCLAKPFRPRDLSQLVATALLGGAQSVAAGGVLGM